MSKVIGVYDGGNATIKINGKDENVGVIVFRTQTRESKPIDHKGYCRQFQKESIIKYLNRIMWDQHEPDEFLLAAGAMTFNSMVLSACDIGGRLIDVTENN